MFLGQDDRAELVHLFVKRFLLAFVKTGILAAMFLGEAFTWKTLTGSLMIVGGTLIMIL